MKDELNTFFRGFYRTLAQPTRRRNDNGSVATGRTDSGRTIWNAEEGKEPMSVELYKAIADWFLEYNTCDGVWAHTFLLLSWNLMCRSENTALIKLTDIVWNESFDSFYIKFAHSKTDQLGELSKNPRHIFANISCPLVCPITSLAMYFSCCFSSQRQGNDYNGEYLFPGGSQEIRFSKMLRKVVSDNEASVRQLGYGINNIGTHSIRKGAATYITSLPGGPSSVSSSLRGGWSMGSVKNRYFRFAETGDEYVSRCLALNPVLSVTLAASPPFLTII